MALRLQASPLRLSLPDAAVRLGMDPEKLHTLRGMVDQGLFSKQQDAPKGRVFILVDEIEHYVSLVGTPEERAKMQRDYIDRKRVGAVTY